MSGTVAQEQEPVKPAAPSLGQRAFGGALWSLGQTAGSKVAGITAQLVLAGMLGKEAFGLFAEVILIVSLCGFGQQLGIGEILIRRHRHFAKWADVAFWISLTAGLLAAGTVVALAPFSPLFFKDAQRLPALLVIAAVGMPFDALTVIHQAKLRVDLRFRELALIGTCNVTGVAILSVTFATIGHYWQAFPITGAMCLVLPRPLMSATVMLMLRRLSGLRFRRGPRLSRWRWILRDSKFFFISTMFNTLLMQGDYLLTGIFFSTEQLGAYYFAFNLSTQTVQLVSSNLTSVLLPSFTKLDQEPQRQRDAYIKVCSMIASVGILICLVQFIVAAPMLHLFFKHKWDDAIPLFEILTLGMIFVLPSGPSMSLLLAQGRYWRATSWTIIAAIVFLVSVGAGASAGAVVFVAVADAIFYMMFGPIGVLIPLRGRLSELMGRIAMVYVYPLASASVAAGLGLVVFQITSSQPPLLQAFCTATSSGIVYIGTMCIWRRSQIREIAFRFQSLFGPLGRFVPLGGKR